jgi:hypothetical protein
MSQDSHDSIDKASLQKEMDDKARALMASGDSFDGVIKHFLDGFAYRYIETPLSQNIQTMQEGENVYFVESRDDRMVEVLKVSNRELKDKLIAFAKSHPPKDKATVAYKVEVIRHNDKLVCRASVNWDFPKHSFNSDTTFTKESVLDYDDLLIVRNKLALHLEEVCELFL